MILPVIFERCISVILKSEGGYVNNPNDLGGETKYGICKRYFPNEDIKNLTIERAKELYFSYYWFPMNLTGIVNDAAILEIFDMGVNSGKGNAIRIAQRLVGTDPDGKLGNITKTAINNTVDFLPKYKQARLEYYARIAGNRNNHVFIQGWINRVLKTHF